MSPLDWCGRGNYSDCAADEAVLWHALKCIISEPADGKQDREGSGEWMLTNCTRSTASFDPNAMWVISSLGVLTIWHIKSGRSSEVGKSPSQSRLPPLFSDDQVIGTGSKSENKWSTWFYYENSLERLVMLSITITLLFCTITPRSSPDHQASALTTFAFVRDREWSDDGDWPNSSTPTDYSINSSLQSSMSHSP